MKQKTKVFWIARDNNGPNNAGVYNSKPTKEGNVVSKYSWHTETESFNPISNYSLESLGIQVLPGQVKKFELREVK